MLRPRLKNKHRYVIGVYELDALSDFRPDGWPMDSVSKEPYYAPKPKVCPRCRVGKPKYSSLCGECIKELQEYYSLIKIINGRKTLRVSYIQTIRQQFVVDGNLVTVFVEDEDFGYPGGVIISAPVKYEDRNDEDAIMRCGFLFWDIGVFTEESTSTWSYGYKHGTC